MTGLFLGSEIENCIPDDVEEAASGITLKGSLVDRKIEAGVSSSEAGLKGIFEGEEIGLMKVTTELVGSSRPEGVRGWICSPESKRTERQSS